MARFCVAVALLLVGGCVLPRPISKPMPFTAAATAETEQPTRRMAAPIAPEARAWDTLGYSVETRPIEILRVGSGRRRVLWIGGIHGDEREGSVATEELPAALAADARLLATARVTLVRDLNPDGTAARRRGNARRVDLNRNFPASNFRASRRHGRQPLDQPEARILHDLIRTEQPHLVIVCHSTRQRGSFINYDGPAEADARQFAELSSIPVVRSDALHSTPGSLGTWVGIDLGIPILTIEFGRGTSPELAWQQTRDAILAAIAGVARP